MPLSIQNISPKWYQSLVNRSLLMVAICSLLILGGGGYAYIEYQGKSVFENREATIDTMLNVSAETLAMALWNFDDRMAKDALEALSRVRGFCGARVVDMDHKVFVAHEWDGFAEELHKKYGHHDALTDTPHHIEFMEIKFQDPNKTGTEKTAIGKLEMCDNHAFLHDDIAHQTHVMSVAILVLVGILILIAALALRIVYAPLAKLGLAMGSLRLGLKKIDDPTLLAPNEIGQLGRQFNFMIEGLAHAQRSLEEKISEALDAAEAAERANRSKSLFLSNMSHELRTPMHAILNYAQMSEKQLAKNDLKKLPKYLTNIQTAGKRLLTLLNDLLDLSKLEAGKMVMSIACISARAVPEYAIAELDSLLKQKHVQAEIRGNLIDEIVCLDKDRMVQVFINLLSNAIKYSPTDGTITVEIVNEPSDEALFRLSVINEGPHIPEQDLKSIFDVFVQSSDTKKTGGTGLGLAICREIVEGHNGAIWAENLPGSGVVFHIVLPRKNEFTQEEAS